MRRAMAEAKNNQLSYFLYLIIHEISPHLHMYSFFIINIAFHINAGKGRTQRLNPAGLRQTIESN
jgi:hypothetical protein